ncbi:MAG: exodeoxyribonuclease VII large subunit, partial [Pseudomonadota bacterium]
PDLLIVARRGGSLEDLWSFNEENVARAAAESEIPLISAVGHETDWTLIDYVADERAPTPTAAAERAVPVRADLMAQVDDLARRHRSATVRHLSTLRAAVQSAARALPRLEALVAVPRQRLDMAMGRLESTLSMAALRTRERVARVSDRLRPALIENRTNAARTRLDTAGKGLSGGLRASARMRRQSLTGISARFHPALLARRVADQTERLATRGDRLVPAFARTIARRRERLERASGLLDAFSYQSVLARGFALVRDGEGAPIRRASGVEGGTALAIQFADGDVSAVVVDGADNGARPVPPKTPPARKPPARKPSTARPSGQASLFDE